MNPEKLQAIFKSANFLLSAVKTTQLPEDTGAEVAFVGRSNVGKSSALNTITQNKQLARTSKTPGRTQAINVFTLDESRRITDLPGYGYAKVPEAMKRQWEQELERYLVERQSLAGVILIMDSRHPLKPLDETLIGWAATAQMPLHVLLTKSDKLNNNENAKALAKVKNYFKERDLRFTAQGFSSLKKRGVAEVLSVLSGWLAL